MRNTIRMNSAAMREKMMPTTHAGDRGQQHDESAERADRHRGQAGENAGDAEQHDQRDDQPVKGLDDGGRDETVPLKQILKFKHRRSPGKSNMSCVQIWLLDSTGPSSECRSGQDQGRHRAGRVAASTSHARGRLEIAANNGHNRASLRLIPIHDADLRRFSSPAISAPSDRAASRARRSWRLPPSSIRSRCISTRRPRRDRC